MKKHIKNYEELEKTNKASHYTIREVSPEVTRHRKHKQSYHIHWVNVYGDLLQRTITSNKYMYQQILQKTETNDMEIEKKEPKTIHPSTPSAFH